MLYKIGFFCLLVYALLLGVNAAEITMVSTEAQQSLAMTIYNQNRALVKDVRLVPLTKGVNEVAFADVSDAIEPSSILAQGDGVLIQEQNFNFDLLTNQNMLKKSVGLTVDVEWINPTTGEIQNKKAQILAYNDKPILKIDNKIETNYPGRVVFNQIPKNLWSKPTLILKLMSKSEKLEKLELSYLTTGISWNADYVAELNVDNNVLDLNGLVTLKNNTEVSYENATLQLVAGDVNFQNERLYEMRAQKQVSYDMAVSNSMESETLGDYHLYTMDRPTNIMSKQTKQVSLLSGTGVKVQKKYKLIDVLDAGSTSEFKDVKPFVFLHFKNAQSEGLGIPLPRGTVRVYQRDSKGRLIFIGQDGINHTAVNQELDLKLGTAFDIVAQGKRTSYTKLSNGYISSFDIAVQNTTKDSVIVRLEQYFPSMWNLESESLPSVKENSNKVYWDIQIPASGEKTLSFKVRVLWR